MTAVATRLTPPVVSDEDRAWAMSLCPNWCRQGHAKPRADHRDTDLHDDGAPLDLADEGPAFDAPVRPAPRATTDVEGNLHFAPGAIRAAQRYDAPAWGEFVDEQIEAFERYFASDRKTADQWSAAFRKTWWPKADPSRRYPKSKPLPVPLGGYVFLTRGTRLHRAALDLAPDVRTRRVWAAHGAQFAATDPLLADIRARALILGNPAHEQ